MKKVFFITMLVLTVMLVAFQCGASSDRADISRTNDQQDIYRISQPLPFYDFSHERSMVVQIYNARNEAVNTWSVWRSSGTGQIEDWCPSIGFGIPYDTSLTNPLKPYWSNSSGSATVEQAEPNGLFSSKNTMATWVLCQMPSGDIAPVYVESTVTVYPWPIKVEAGEIVHLYEGGSSIIFETHKE